MKLVKYILILVLTIASANISNALVENEDKPVRGEWDLNLQEVWSVDSAGDDFFVRLNSPVIDDEGNVYVLDKKYVKIFVFNSEGKFVRTIGRQGEGPGEYKNPNILFFSGNYLIVVDRGQRVHYFTREGKYRNTLRYDLNARPRGFIDVLHFIAIRSNIGEDGDEKKEKEPLNLYDIKTKKASLIAEIRAEKVVTASNGSGRGSATVYVQFDQLTPTVVTALDNKKVYFGMNDVYSIKKVDLEGKELLSFSIKGRKRKKIPMEYKESQIKLLSPEAQSMKRKLIDSMPDDSTYFNKIDVDENGFIYVYLTDFANVRGQEIDIFSPDGTYLYHSYVKLPGKYRTIGLSVMKGDHMYIRVEDEGEELRLIKYKINRPSL